MVILFVFTFWLLWLMLPWTFVKQQKVVTAVIIWHNWCCNPFFQMEPRPAFWSNLPLCVIIERGSSQLLLQKLQEPACAVLYPGSQGVSIWYRVSPWAWGFESWSKPLNQWCKRWLKSLHSCYSTTSQRHLLPAAWLFWGSSCLSSRDLWVLPGLQSPVNPGSPGSFQ